MDGVITAVSNVFQGLPGMVLMIALVGVLERGTRSIILALSSPRGWAFPAWCGGRS